MDFADDIAYSVHDTEDFFRAGLIPLDRLAGLDPDELNRFYSNVEKRKKADGLEFDRERMSKVFEALAGDMIWLLVTEPYSGEPEQRTAVGAL